MTEDKSTANITAKIIELEARRDELIEAIKNLRSTLAERVPEGKNEIGDYTYNKFAAKRFDDGLAKKNLSVKDYDAISVTKADATKAKAFLSDEKLALCQKSSAVQVRIELRD